MILLHFVIHVIAVFLLSYVENMAKAYDSVANAEYALKSDPGIRDLALPYQMEYKDLITIENYVRNVISPANQHSKVMDNLKKRKPDSMWSVVVFLFLIVPNYLVFSDGVYAYIGAAFVLQKSICFLFSAAILVIVWAFIHFVYKAKVSILTYDANIVEQYFVYDPEDEHYLLSEAEAKRNYQLALRSDYIGRHYGDISTAFSFAKTAWMLWLPVAAGLLGLL